LVICLLVIGWPLNSPNVELLTAYVDSQTVRPAGPSTRTYSTIQDTAPYPDANTSTDESPTTQVALRASEQAAPDPTQNRAPLPPRMIVKMRSEPTGPSILKSTGDASLDALMTRFDVRAAAPLFDTGRGDSALKQNLGLSRIYVLALPPSSNLQDALAAFSADPAVEYAEPDFAGYGAGTPDDAMFGQQWSLHNTGQSGGEPDADIDAPDAWDVSVGITSTVLAIIDTGVDLDHPDLAEKVVPGYDFVNDDAIPQDNHGHGTHVAGIAAAVTNNATGVAGVCPECRIMPLKALNSDNWGYYSWWADAIEYAVDSGADVINMSMGGTSYSQLLRDAVLYAYNANVPIVAAMMNDGDSTSYYPAAFAETIAVGSTDRHDDRSSFSNFGDHIDLVAPGTSILSTMWDDTYATWNGTSMATPHVAGVIGLAHPAHPGYTYTVEEWRTILRTTADDQVGPSNEDKKGWDPYFGSGRLNAAQAVQYVSPPETILTVCHGGGCDYDNIQDAVDTASDSDVIKVATGTYTGVNSYGNLAQVVYISKSVTIRGGYTTAFTEPPVPDANPTTVDAQGGGRVLYITGGINPIIEGLRITGGDASGLGGDPAGGDAGGGVYVISAGATLRDNYVFSNTARWGGGLYLRENDASLSGNTITANTADVDGGGLYLWKSDGMLSGNTITTNTASHDGGGLYLRESNATLTNTILADNQADIAGSGLYIQSSLPRLLHTTIVRNTGGDGSGIYVTDDEENYSTVALINTILVNHMVGVTVTAGNTVTLEATLWGKDTWANVTDWDGAGTVVTGTPAHNTWGDPAFVAPNAGDYHIGADSAALDAGVDAGVTTDVDGDPRPIGASHDVGADECPPALSVTKQASPDLVQASAQLVYTIRVTNTGSLDLHAIVTDVLPGHVVPGGLRTWTPTIAAPGGVWMETTVVTVEMGYAGPLTSMVQVTTEEGVAGTDTNTVIVAEKLVTVGPSEGGIIVATGADGMTTTIKVPPGAVTEPTQLAYTSVPTITCSLPGFVFAGRAFRLEAHRNSALHPGLVFEKPVTVTIHYTEANVAGLDENRLELRYWNGSAWSTDGIIVVKRDTANNRLVVTVAHLSEFAMFAKEQQDPRKVHLPLIVRQYPHRGATWRTR